MNIFKRRELRHGLPGLAALGLPLALMIGCSSAPTGNAPGVAGGQSLTPGITNYPMVYVKQPVLAANTDKQNKAATPTDIDARDLITSITGSDLYVRDTASAGSPETNVTAPITMGQGAVRDLDVSPDGTKVVFSLRLPLNPQLKNDDPKQPNWKIYQYDAKAKTVTQLTTDDVTSGHDVGAHYLPDGRIIFSSTRQVATQEILLDEGRPQYQAVTTDQQSPIFLLHVMNADGSGMHQISFNTNHDFGPSVLANGQVVFSRWDTENGGRDQPVRHQSGRYRPAASLWGQQPCHRRQHRRHQQQRDPILERAPARRRYAARHRPAVSRHAARRRHRRHQLQRVRRDQPAELPDQRRQGAGADERHLPGRHHGCEHAVRRAAGSTPCIRSTTAPTGCW